MDKEEVIKLIKGRIEDEYRKHPLLDWARIAAGKIYTQWFEYFNNENKDLSLEEYWMHQEKSAKAQEDMAKELDNLKGQLREWSVIYQGFIKDKDGISSLALLEYLKENYNPPTNYKK